jgi:hypothetical protein
MTIYFFVGVLVQRKRGEVGWDLVPNRSMWWGLMRLIREGCAVTFMSCIGVTKSSYNIGFAKFEQL